MLRIGIGLSRGALKNRIFDVLEANGMTDGVWAPVWCQTVEQSTGFGPPRREVGLAELPDVLKPIAAAARPIYDRLAAYRLKAAGGGATPTAEPLG